MRHYLPSLCLAAILAFYAGVNRMNGSVLRAAQTAPERVGVASASLEAAELAQFLGISTWAFSYEGGRPECWIEVIEDGQKTVSKPRALEVKESNTSKEAGHGKILFFFRPGVLELRINSGVAGGGAGIALPADALWWGWKGNFANTQGLRRPLKTKPGQVVTLLDHVVEEAKESVAAGKKPRKVQLTLKVRLAD